VWAHRVGIGEGIVFCFDTSKVSELVVNEDVYVRK